MDNSIFQTHSGEELGNASAKRTKKETKKDFYDKFVKGSESSSASTTESEISTDPFELNFVASSSNLSERHTSSENSTTSAASNNATDQLSDILNQPINAVESETQGETTQEGNNDKEFADRTSFLEDHIWNPAMDKNWVNKSRLGEEIPSISSSISDFPTLMADRLCEVMRLLKLSAKKRLKHPAQIDRLIQLLRPIAPTIVFSRNTNGLEAQTATRIELVEQRLDELNVSIATANDIIADLAEREVPQAVTETSQMGTGELDRKVQFLENELLAFKNANDEATRKLKKFFIELNEKSFPLASVIPASVKNANLATRVRQYLGPNTAFFLFEWELMQEDPKFRPLEEKVATLAKNLLGLNADQSGSTIRRRVEAYATLLIAPLGELFKLRMYPSQLSSVELIKNLSSIVLLGEMIWIAGKLTSADSRFLLQVKEMLQELSSGKRLNLGETKTKLDAILPRFMRMDVGHPKCSEFNDDFWFSCALMPIEGQTENLLNYEDRCIAGCIPRREGEKIDSQGSQPENPDQPSTSRQARSTYERVRDEVTQEEASLLDIRDRMEKAYSDYEEDEEKFDIFSY